MDFCGAFWRVAELTDGNLMPFTFSWNERSKMALYHLDLWGIMANGEILRFVGMLFLMSFHLTIFA